MVTMPRGPGPGAARVLSARTAARLLALLLPLLVLVVPEVSEARTTDYVVARPTSIDFGKKQVGREYYKRTRITNISDRELRLLVYAGLPDDFGFGLMPGSTCPVLDGGAVVEAGTSCYAVVRFTPTEFFAGWFAVGEMWADSHDPVTGALLEHHLIPVTGTGVL